ncbi:unnamed protein product [Gongylonema pulchrum]|uniref:Homeobox domain-containing protein n=1 Tax=Gongylonema pulchrum TaxID=637853 RepID=A0A183DRW1_9BILA|nr:unnamed protein product [Gongylonema pulchrum]
MKSEGRAESHNSGKRATHLLFVRIVVREISVQHIKMSSNIWQVKTWFQNRRMKHKKIVRKQGDSSASVANEKNEEPGIDSDKE